MKISDADLECLYDGLCANPKQQVGGALVLSIIDRLRDAERACAKHEADATEHIRIADVLVAHAEGELSEGAASRLVARDRIDLRGMKQLCVEAGVKHWKAYRAAHPQTTIAAQ
jgi:hypothetical protein